GRPCREIEPPFPGQIGEFQVGENALQATASASRPCQIFRFDTTVETSQDRDQRSRKWGLFPEGRECLTPFPSDFSGTRENLIQRTILGEEGDRGFLADPRSSGNIVRG